MKFELRDTNKTWSSKDRESRTVRFHIDLNTICSNTCKYCYSRCDSQNWGLLMSSEYINTKLFPNMQQLHESLSSNNKFLDVVLLGGEPTLHPKFNTILDFFSSLENTRISITSNGNLNYKNSIPRSNIRWAFTFHPSQVSNIDSWIAPILEHSNDWWEVAVSPLIDCWGTDTEIRQNSDKVKTVIDVCHQNNIKVQPTFQFNPYSEEDHIDMELVEKYYSYLESEFPIYQYGTQFLNDYTVLKEKKNYLKNCLCINNNIQLTVKGQLKRCCSNEPLEWKNLEDLNTNMICPLKECTCYGFLSLYKEIYND